MPTPRAPPAWLALQADVLSAEPGRLLTHLTACTYPSPSFTGTQGSVCNLMGTDQCRRFKAPEVSAFLAALFLAIQQHTCSGRDAQLPPVRLSPHDLFHAHLFVVDSNAQRAAALPVTLVECDLALAQGSDARVGLCASRSDHGGGGGGGLGLLFHAKEYPRYCKATFPYALGYCQEDSGVQFEQRAMDTRNVVYFQGQLLALDVGQGALLHSALLWPETLEMRTVYETDLGDRLADVCCYSPTNALHYNCTTAGTLRHSPAPVAGRQDALSLAHAGSGFTKEQGVGEQGSANVCGGVASMGHVEACDEEVDGRVKECSDVRLDADISEASVWQRGSRGVGASHVFGEGCAPSVLRTAGGTASQTFAAVGLEHGAFVSVSGM